MPYIHIDLFLVQKFYLHIATFWFFFIKTKIPNILLYLPVAYGNNTSDRVTLTVPSHYPTALSSYHVPYSKSAIFTSRYNS